LVPLAGAAPALVPLLFGARWSPAVDALSIACLAVVIHTPVMIAGQSFLWASGDSKSPLHAMLVDAAICVCVGLPLVPIVGVVGLAAAGVLAATAHTVILARAIERECQVRVFQHVGVPVVAWIVAAVTASAVTRIPGELILRAALGC